MISLKEQIEVIKVLPVGEVAVGNSNVVLDLEKYGHPADLLTAIFVETVGVGGTLNIAISQDNDAEGDFTDEIDEIAISKVGDFLLQVTPGKRYLKFDMTVATAAITFGIVAIAGNKRFKETRDKVAIIEEE